MLCTKGANQSTIFQPFECFNESSSISHAIFEATRLGFIPILHIPLFSAMKEKSSVFFVPQTVNTLDKKSTSKRIFQTFEWLGDHLPNLSCNI